MMTMYLRLGVALLLILAPPPLRAQVQPAPDLVLLIGIDGLRPDYVLDAERLGLRIPHLRGFLSRGSYATGVTGVIPTVTYPSFTTVLTGVSPARHGIATNTTFDPFSRNAGGWYWYSSDIAVETLWHAAARAGRTTANVHWPVSAGAPVTWGLPQIWRTGMPDDRKLLAALATPGVLDILERRVGAPYADGIDESIDGDENRARFAQALLEQYRPGFMTAYFTALDHEQHGYGPFTPQAFAVLERIDALLGRLLATAEAVYGPRVTVAIASDHGFKRTTHEVHLAAALRGEGLLTFAPGDETRPTAWEATTWGGGGSTAIVLRDPANAAIRERTRALLGRLAADTANGIRRVLDRTELDRRGGVPGAEWVVDLRPGFRTGARTSGPLVTRGDVGGTHGFVPDDPDLRATFLVMGPGIRAGYSLGLIDMRDIAPTIALLMGERMSSAEGSPLTVNR